ncbi:bifunctional adenosylcobinamide kinase/adenosylcobinamide-phosphate guanylyltransferase [Rhodospirillaceae bacterium SYSU D60014]|uniref:bifunctional adenosylcobinamide kinase/adenosylcobinamide-phosphate guanylyltransferase n=1 Tax=Virgifigura deserti TaxID=2268457 RepID=UPI000E663954
MTDPSLAVRGQISASESLAPVTLVLGGARSGKSRFAERLVAAHPGPRVYLATAEAGDAEMAERIRQHLARRGADWATIEAPLDLADALVSANGRAVLVDCLTLWLSNLMGAGRDPAAETSRLVAELPQLRGPVVFVSNEVGLGIVPDNALARAFRDAAGRLHQAIAEAADRVYFVAAGLPLALKNTTAAPATTTDSDR